jgi:hypothetical protein
MLGVFLSLTALVMIAPSVAYELKDPAKLMVEGSGATK